MEPDYGPDLLAPNHWLGLCMIPKGVFAAFAGNWSSLETLSFCPGYRRAAH